MEVSKADTEVLSCRDFFFNFFLCVVFHGKHIVGGTYSVGVELVSIQFQLPKMSFVVVVVVVG